MTMSILQLGTDEVWTALDDVNPVDLLAGELTGADSEPGGRLTPSPASGPDLVLLEEPGTGARTLLPSAALRACRAAALSALSARALLNAGVVTAAVLGTGLAVQLHLSVVSRWVPGISHLAVHRPSGVQRRVQDQLDLAGISLSITAGVADSVFGATLVIVAGPVPLTSIQPTKGALLINATGRELPDELLDRIDQIYVDDMRLLDKVGHRNVTRRVEAGLCDVLTGTHGGRARAADVVLVDLLAVDALDARLAAAIQRVARDRGLGVWSVESR